MTPYYEDDFATIYHGDCREIVIDPAHVDLVVTDPPYGIAYRPSGGGRGPGKFDGDWIAEDDQDFDPRWLLDFGRCVIFGANHFAHILPPGGWVIWSKVQDNAEVLGASSKRSLAEVAWTNCHRRVALYNYFWSASPVFRHGENLSQLHPTQKPVALMGWIISELSEPGDLVFDPYMGSGPAAKAARDQSRRYIGIEIEERYCEIAAKRLAQSVLDFGGVA